RVHGHRGVPAGLAAESGQGAVVRQERRPRLRQAAHRLPAELAERGEAGHGHRGGGGELLLLPAVRGGAGQDPDHLRPGAEGQAHPGGRVAEDDGQDAAPPAARKRRLAGGVRGGSGAPLATAQGQARAPAAVGGVTAIPSRRCRGEGGAMRRLRPFGAIKLIVATKPFAYSPAGSRTAPRNSSAPVASSRMTNRNGRSAWKRNW